MRKSLILIFLSIPAFSNMIFGYCFNSFKEAKGAKKQIKTFLTSKDIASLRKETNCLEVVMPDNSRSELFRKVIEMNYKVTRTYGDFQQHATVSQKTCRLKFEQTIEKESDKRKVAIGKKNNIYDYKLNNKSGSVSTLLLSHGKSGMIAVGNNNLKLTCMVYQKITKVDVEFKSSGNLVSTSINMVPGKKVDLGDVVENLNNKNRSLDINSGIEVSKKVGVKKTKYLLSLE